MLGPTKYQNVCRKNIIIKKISKKKRIKCWKLLGRLIFIDVFFGEEFSKHILLQFDCNSNVFFHVITKFIKLCQPTQTYTHLHTSIIKQTATLNKKQSLGKCFLTFFSMTSFHCYLRWGWGFSGCVGSLYGNSFILC